MLWSTPRRSPRLAGLPPFYWSNPWNPEPPLPLCIQIPISQSVEPQLSPVQTPEKRVSLFFAEQPVSKTEQDAAIQRCYRYLDHCRYSTDINTRAFYATRLYLELTAHSYLIAKYPALRTVALKKMYELRNNLGQLTDLGNRQNLARSLDLFENHLLKNIHDHPDYVVDSADSA